MKKLVIPEGYESKISSRDTQKAIKIIKDTFQSELAKALSLDRVTAPIIVTKESGINDDLNGVERKVHFTMKEIKGEGEVVQSLAKWKRMTLYHFGYSVGEGIYTDMNAIRRDDDVDNTHSIFVDQWDWEKVISRQQRNLDFLCETAKTIVKVLAYTKRLLSAIYPCLKNDICEDLFCLTTQELEDLYPNKSPKERENAICKKYKSVFLMQIGGPLKSGKKHDGRAPDYDDWNLNGDILIWDATLNSALEISSMGIRVDADSMKSQLASCHVSERERFPYHQGILQDQFPLTIGGGIGQSRICMLILEKAHIGEVQFSIWPDQMVEDCKKAGIPIL
jgi:aspartate--ammonia ligase